MTGPYMIPHPLLLMILGLVLVYMVASFLRRYKWNDKTLYHKFALTAGALGFLIALTPLQELDSTRPDNPRGMLIVGIVALAMLLLLARRLKRKASQ